MCFLVLCSSVYVVDSECVVRLICVSLYRVGMIYVSIVSRVGVEVVRMVQRAACTPVLVYERH